MCTDLSEISNRLEEIVISLSGSADEQKRINGQLSNSILEDLKNLQSLVKRDVDKSSEAFLTKTNELSEKSRIVTVDCPNDVKSRIDGADAEWKRISSQQNKTIIEQAEELTECKKQLSELRAAQSPLRDDVMRKMMSDIESIVQSSMSDLGSSMDQNLDPLDDCCKRLDATNEKLKSKAEKVDESHSSHLDNIREGIDEWTKNSVEANELYTAESNERESASKEHKTNINSHLDLVASTVQAWSNQNDMAQEGKQADSNRLRKEIVALVNCNNKCESNVESMREEVSNSISTMIEDSTAKVDKSQNSLKDFAASLDTKIDSLDECNNRLGGTNDKLKAKIEEMDTSHGEHLTNVRAGVDDWTKHSVDSSEVNEEEHRAKGSAAADLSQKMSWNLRLMSDGVDKWKKVALDLEPVLTCIDSITQQKIPEISNKCETSTETLKEELTTSSSSMTEESNTKVAECEDNLKEWISSCDAALDSITVPENGDLLNNAREILTSSNSHVASLRNGVDAWSRSSSERREAFTEEETTRKALMKTRKEHMSTFIDEARDKCAKWEQSDVSAVSAIKEDVNKLLKETKAVEGARQKCDSSTEHIKNEVTCE